LNKYEAMFIIDSTLDEESVKSLIEKIKNLLETSAKLEGLDEWGKRRFAYPINKQSEGYYFLANFEAEPDFPNELERVFKITDGILKYLIVKKDK
jgi:small subunit ribosomal protein S6